VNSLYKVLYIIFRGMKIHARFIGTYTRADQKVSCTNSPQEHAACRNLGQCGKGDISCPSIG
jgi:hypothetical protein